MVAERKVLRSIVPQEVGERILLDAQKRGAYAQVVASSGDLFVFDQDEGGCFGPDTRYDRRKIHQTQRGRPLLIAEGHVAIEVEKPAEVDFQNLWPHQRGKDKEYIQKRVHG